MFALNHTTQNVQNLPTNQILQLLFQILTLTIVTPFSYNSYQKDEQATSGNLLSKWLSSSPPFRTRHYYCMLRGRHYILSDSHPVKMATPLPAQLFLPQRTPQTRTHNALIPRPLSSVPSFILRTSQLSILPSRFAMLCYTNDAQFFLQPPRLPNEEQ